MEAAFARADAEVDACAQKVRDAFGVKGPYSTPAVLRALDLIHARACRALREAEALREAAAAALERPAGRNLRETIAQRVGRARAEERAACARYECSAGWAADVMRRVEPLDAERRKLQVEIATLAEGMDALVRGKEQLGENVSALPSGRERLIALKRQSAAAKRAAKVARCA